ncbi:MAG: hypothetical protein JWP18_1691 [Solirubrobacterales bacterium]|nr:hypothetical protein [Solirubrobacterales bacterium]
MIELPPWATFLRVAANGRWECSCQECGRLFWLTRAERRWSCCPHCVGWWTLTPAAPAGATAGGGSVRAGEVDPVLLPT